MIKRKPPIARHQARRWSAPRGVAASKRRAPKLRVVTLETADRCELGDRINQKPSAERIHCGCGKVYAGGSVVNDPPFIDSGGQCTVMRRCYCDHCDHVMVWIELALPNGTPLGIVQGELAVCTARGVIERFLKHHPWAAGVSQI